MTVPSLSSSMPISTPTSGLKRHHRSATVSRVQPKSLRSAHPPTQPPWIRTLRWWQRTSTLLALLSGTTVVGIYSWTVYTQERWNHQYEALQEMRRHERQFLLTQESIANSLRETAARSDMVPLVPERMIEVPIASSSAAEVPTEPEAPQDSPEPFFPVGY